MNEIRAFLSDFTFYYPIFMAYLWMFGGLYYRYHWENVGGRNHNERNALPEYPFVSLLVPCHNEGFNAEETILSLLRQNWPFFEVIAINDASTDNTGEVLDRLAHEHENLRVMHLQQNQGKAMALRIGALTACSEYLICIDGDALLDPNATHWIMGNFLSSNRVGAVTGNPRIRNRTSLLGKIQVGEFASIIGMIKRAQRIYGRVFTVSGVVAAFRRSALQEVGYWNTDMATEDIDISWRLQLRQWDIRYEPKALCWILMPETLKGIWRQRLRWAQGGAEVALRHGGELLQWRNRRMWPVFAEYALSVLWSYLVAALILIWVASTVVELPFVTPTLLPGWHGLMLGITCLLQFSTSLHIDARYEPGLRRYYLWVVWYPMVYWTLNVFTTVVGFPKAWKRKKGQAAIWKSPDRGLHQEPPP